MKQKYSMIFCLLVRWTRFFLSSLEEPWELLDDDDEDDDEVLLLRSFPRLLSEVGLVLEVCPVQDLDFLSRDPVDKITWTYQIYIKTQIMRHVLHAHIYVCVCVWIKTC